MKRSYIKDADGYITGVRDTTDDGSRSITYEYDRDHLVDPRGKAVDVTDHDKDGTSTSYEYDPDHLYDPRGKRK